MFKRRFFPNTSKMGSSAILHLGFIGLSLPVTFVVLKKVCNYEVYALEK